MRKGWLLAVAALGMVLAGCGGHKTEQAAAPAPVQAEVVKAEALEAPRAIEVPGVVVPEQEAVLSSRAMGPVVQVEASAGDLVKKGQLLLEIQQDMSHGQLSQAKGALAQAQAALSLAARNYERYQKLHAKASCSEIELDMARMQHEQAKGAVEQAQGAVAAAGSVAEESALRAPFDAMVVERMVNVGDLAAPGRPLVKLQTRSGRRLALTVREADAPLVKVGQTLDVALDSRADLGRLKGRVVEIVPAADPATHTVGVRLELAGAPQMSGLSGRAWLPGPPRRTVRVPADAVLRTGGLSLVVVVDEGGLARTRAVTVGSATAGTLEVLSGLSGGETVVRNLKAPITDGTPVQAR